MQASSFRRYWWGILLFALLLRVAAACYWQNQLFEEGKALRFGDSDSYWVLANKISKGLPYEYAGENSKIFRAPLYPMFLAPIHYLTDWGWLAPYRDWLPYLLARFAGAMLGTVSVAIIMRIAFDIGKQVAAIGAGILAAIYPGAIGMSVFLLSESIFVPLMLVCLYASWRSMLFLVDSTITGVHTHNSEPSNQLPLSCNNRSHFQWIHSYPQVHRVVLWSAIAGVMYGLCCLARPSWSLWGGMLFIYLIALKCFYASQLSTSQLSTSQLTWRSIALVLGVTATSVILTMSPWWIRNYSITKRFVPTTLQVGPSLYDGLHEGATGSSDEGMKFVEEFWAIQTAEDEAAIARGETLESTYEWRLDRIMKRAAMDWLQSNPTEALRLGGVKLFKTWRPLPVAQELANPLIRFAEASSYLTIMLCGTAGLWYWRKVPTIYFFALPAVYFSVLHMVFIGSIRYRQPAVLVFCILAGLGISGLRTWMKQRANASKQSVDTSIA